MKGKINLKNKYTIKNTLELAKKITHTVQEGYKMASYEYITNLYSQHTYKRNNSNDKNKFKYKYRRPHIYMTSN